ncbi:MAG TPA: twin-arginine translocase subunit TatC [Gemmatimonadaceae bacterium]|nr:twin-arginine translocase subunit TatC [Gemmatimonadaceae bacterium]
MAKQRTAAEMPFLDHLEELRWRILWSLAALLVGVAIGFAIVAQGDVFKVLEAPIAPYLGGKKLVFTHPGDPFSIMMTASFGIGVVLALPVILYQVWAFLSPALYPHEKRLMIPVVLGATLLFAAGVALSFFVVLPLTLGFLLRLHTESLEPMITAGDYFSFAVNTSLMFGVVFELPIAILALTALNIVTPQFLARFRRHAAVLCILLSAFITPGQDIASLAALTLPLYFLYEVSVVLAYAIDRRRRRRAAAAEAGQYEGSAA